MSDRLVDDAEAERQRDAQAHDAWFRAEVADALVEADDARVRRMTHAAAKSSLGARIVMYV